MLLNVSKARRPKGNLSLMSRMEGGGCGIGGVAGWVWWLGLETQGM
jgi:hypothetical protein